MSDAGRDVGVRSSGRLSMPPVTKTGAGPGPAPLAGAAAAAAGGDWRAVANSSRDTGRRSAAGLKTGVVPGAEPVIAGATVGTAVESWLSDSDEGDADLEGEPAGVSCRLDPEARRRASCAAILEASTVMCRRNRRSRGSAMVFFAADGDEPDSDPLAVEYIDTLPAPRLNANRFRSPAAANGKEVPDGEVRSGRALPVATPVSTSVDSCPTMNELELASACRCSAW